jgi:hypothetical protein
MTSTDRATRHDCTDDDVPAQPPGDTRLTGFRPPARRTSRALASVRGMSPDAVAHDAVVSRSRLDLRPTTSSRCASSADHPPATRPLGGGSAPIQPLASEPCPAPNTEPRLQRLVFFSILPGSPDEQAAYENDGQEQYQTEHDCSNSVHGWRLPRPVRSTPRRRNRPQLVHLTRSGCGRDSPRNRE